jgi:hypothetical protein
MAKKSTTNNDSGKSFINLADKTFNTPRKRVFFFCSLLVLVLLVLFLFYLLLSKSENTKISFKDFSFELNNGKIKVEYDSAIKKLGLYEDTIRGLKLALSEMRLSKEKITKKSQEEINSLENRIKQLNKKLVPYQTTIGAYKRIVETKLAPATLDSVLQLNNLTLGFKTKLQEFADEIKGKEDAHATEKKNLQQQYSDCQQLFEEYKTQAEKDKQIAEKQIAVLRAGSNSDNSNPTFPNNIEKQLRVTIDCLKTVNTTIATSKTNLETDYQSYKIEMNKKNPFQVLGLFKVEVADGSQEGTIMPNLTMPVNDTPIPIQKIPKIGITIEQDRVEKKLRILGIEDLSGDITFQLRYYDAEGYLAPLPLLQGQFPSYKLQNIQKSKSHDFFNESAIQTALLEHFGKNASQTEKDFAFEMIYKYNGCAISILLERARKVKLRNTSQGKPKN